MSLGPSQTREKPVGVRPLAAVTARSPHTRVPETKFRESPLRSISTRGGTPHPLWHRLCPRRMSLVAKGCCHRSVAISIVAVGGFVATSPRQQHVHPQRPDVAY